MAINTRGFNLRQFPVAPRLNFTPRSTLSGLGQGIQSGLLAMGQRRDREQAEEEQREQEQQEREQRQKITLAALSAASGDDSALEELDLGPEETFKAIEMASSLRSMGAQQEKQSLQIEELRREQEEAAEEAQVSEAFEQVRRGEATLEDFKGEPFYGQLSFQVDMLDPDKRFSTFERDGVQFVKDELNNKIVSTQKPTELDRMLRRAGLSDEETEQFARKFLGQKTKERKGSKVKLTDDLEVTLKDEEKEALDNYTLALEGKEEEGQGLLSVLPFVSTKGELSDSDKRERRVKFVKTMRERNIPPGAAQQLVDDPNEINRQFFNETFGEGAAEELLGIEE